MSEILVSESLYQTAAEQYIVFGPGFRWITGLWRGQNEALARLSLPEKYGSLDGYWLHPGLLDACFQVAGVTLDETASSETLLPFMLKTLSINAVAQGQSWWCHVVQTDITSWDIQLLGDDGQVLVNMQGFEMRKAARDAMQKRQLADWLYEVAWQPKLLAQQTLPHIAGCWLIVW